MTSLSRTETQMAARIRCPADFRRTCQAPHMAKESTTRRSLKPGVKNGIGQWAGNIGIVDATIIGAAGSTKNAENARDPEVRQTRKGQQW